MLSIAWLLAGCPEDPARVNDHVYEILELNQRKELEISRLRQELTASKAALGQLRKEVELSRQAGTLGGNDVVALLEEKRRLEQRVQDQQEFLTFCRERTFTLERENLELREQDEAFFTAATRLEQAGGEANVLRARELYRRLIERFPLSHLRRESEQRVERLDLTLEAIQQQRRQREQLAETIAENEALRERYGKSIGCNDLLLDRKGLLSQRVNFRAMVQKIDPTTLVAWLDCHFTAETLEFRFSGVPPEERRPLEQRPRTRDHFLFIGMVREDPPGTLWIEGTGLHP